MRTRPAPRCGWVRGLGVSILARSHDSKLQEIPLAFGRSLGRSRRLGLQGPRLCPRGEERRAPSRGGTAPVPKSPQHRLLRGPCYGFGTSEQEHGAKPYSAKRLRGCKGWAGAGRRAGSPFQQPSRTAHSCWCVALLSGCTGISMYNTFFFFFLTVLIIIPVSLHLPRLP